MTGNPSFAGCTARTRSLKVATSLQIRLLVNAGIKNATIELPDSCRCSLKGIPAPVLEIAAPYRPHKIYRSANGHTFSGLGDLRRPGEAARAVYDDAITRDITINRAT